MTKLYCPVRSSVLAEYLASGFIGLTSSIEPDHDEQQQYFPQVLVMTNPLIMEGSALLVMGCDESEDSVESMFLLEGPVPVARVHQVIFANQTEREDFAAIYGSLPDVPVSLFELTDATGEDFELDSSWTTGLLPPASKQRANRESPSQLVSTLIGVKELAACIGPEAAMHMTLTVRGATSRKICESVMWSVLRGLKFDDQIVGHSRVLLQVYLDAVESSSASNKIETSMILDEMPVCLAALSEERVSTADRVAVDKIIEKISRVHSGFDRFEEFSDSPSMLIQRAVCLACIAKDLEAFSSLRRNLSIGPMVEGFARLLVAKRLRVNRIEKDIWRSTRSEFDGFLLAAASIATTRRAMTEGKIQPPEQDFSFKQSLLINGFSVFDQRREAPHQILLVVSMLRSCGYRPVPLADSTILIDQRDTHSGENLRINLRLRTGPMEMHSPNVEILTEVTELSDLFQKKRGRDDALKVAGQYMVSIALGSDSKIMNVARYQLLGTMDKEELASHVELVAAAVRALKRL